MIFFNLFHLNFAGGLLFILWQLTIAVQGYMGYGTAYRLTKANGDNGLSLFGWLLLTNLAALIPGLGVWMWLKFRNLGAPYKTPDQLKDWKD